MEEVKLIIDGITVTANKNDTILDAAKKIGIDIPTLCYLKDVSKPSSCRICVVEVEGSRKLVTACSTPVREGMVVRTATERVLKARKLNLELLLSNHNKACLSCNKSLNCTLQKLSKEYGCDEFAYTGELSSKDKDESSPCIVKDLSKCIQCGRCVAVCKKVQGVSAISKIQRGYNAKIGCNFDGLIVDSTCVGCGQCTLVCPTGALMEKNEVSKVLDMLADENNIVIAQIAPAVRVAIGEEFGTELGAFCEGKLTTALKMIGFDKVFDVNTGADFTVLEEGAELIERVTKGEKLPMFSSCCPGWYKFVEEFYPEYRENLSTCKSPTEMLGALIKSFYAEQRGVDPARIKVVDIMPCTGKKGEKLRGDDVDVALTTRELAMLIRKKGINFAKLPESELDNPLGEYSGAALIFGVSGGVTEAVLRTAYKKITGKEPSSLDFEVVRDSQGIKDVELNLGDSKVLIGIVNGLANAKKVMEDIKAGKNYTFVEVMACPGGCINGGGQPYVDKNDVSVADIVKSRGANLYKKDKELNLRQSDKNKSVLDIYKDYLDKKPGLAHELFHVKH